MADQTLAVSRAIGMASLGFGALATVAAAASASVWRYHGR